MVFGVNCSPFLLAAVLLTHFAKYDSPLARQMERNTYVDNVLMEAETPESNCYGLLHKRTGSPNSVSNGPRHGQPNQLHNPPCH
jgi:hypothetical protein